MRLKILFSRFKPKWFNFNNQINNYQFFANYDAYINNYQAIVTKTASEIDNFYYPDVYNSTCYINYGNGGKFLLQKVSDTSIPAAYQPRSPINFGSGNKYHYF